MQTDTMTTDAVLLPPPPLPVVQISYRLCFDHYFQHGTGKYDYFHLVRSRSLYAREGYRGYEENYWRGLEQNRTDFAAQINEPFDLLVDPPSNSGYHRPFLSAFAQQLAGVQCAHLLKNTPDRACPENIEIIRATTKFFGDVHGNIGTRQNVLIVDDVYCSGTIVRVTIEKLFEAGLPQDAKITVACPLRMPARNDLTVEDVWKVMEQSNSNDPEEAVGALRDRGGRC